MPKGFILHPTYFIEQGRPVVHLFGKLDTGESFVVRDDRTRPYIFIRRNDEDRARMLTSLSIAPADLMTMDGFPASKITLDVPPDTPGLREKLGAEGIRCYEADIPFATRYLIDHGIRGSMKVDGEFKKGRIIDRIYENPELLPSQWVPDLTLLSLDIETDMQSRHLLSVALWGEGVSEVHVRAAHPPMGRLPRGANVYPDEATLLKRLHTRIREIDPDIITGWNVIDFDMDFLLERYKKHGIPFTWGRADLLGKIRSDTSGWGTSRAILPGRVVLDGLNLLRGAFIRMEDYRLETVAQEVLGEGKILSHTDRGPEIERLYHEDLPKFVEYNLTDARLVPQILDRLQLIPLAIRRSLLTGMPMDRVSASIASFDFLYLSEIRKRGIVAPSVDRDIPIQPTAGGFVLDSVPGIYDNILVFDYRSLYPSLIRTFHLDPLNLVRRIPGVTEEEDETGDRRDSDEGLVIAPNGARFRSDGGILPELLSRFFPEREEALGRGDRIAATAIKILMNSFYGVLATPRCRFYSSETANAITLFGQKVLRWTKERVESRTLRVLYGDTDSIFVESGLSDGEEAHRFGLQLADELNEELESLVRGEYGMKNYLKLQFERLYSRFFMPGLRHSSEGSKKRYAGIVDEKGERHLVFTGLESVRRDWTDLAKRFQKELLTMVFNEGTDIPRDQLEEMIRRFVKQLRDGEMDDLLIYRKALRKEVTEYTKTTPPHVKAAQLLGEKSGRIISYVMTADGAQPAAARTAPLDYDHYVEKQIRPIAEAVLLPLGHSWERIWSRQDELPLF